MQLIYEDDGIGIPLENKKQLFRQGFSTGGSTGFGLFLSKRILEVYGWTITENGKPGEGAKFVMNIPQRSVLTTKEQDELNKLKHRFFATLFIDYMSVFREP